MPHNVEHIASRYEPKIQKALLSAFAQLRSVVKVKELENILITQGFDGVVVYIQQLNIAGVIDKAIVDDLNEAIIDSGRIAFSVIPAGAVLDKTFRFNLLTYNASQYVNNYQVELVSEITRNTQEAIVQSLRTDILAGVNPRSTARNFRNTIGLTQTQAQSVRNFNTMLREGSAQSLTRRLRDRRFDSTIINSLESGKPLSEKQISAMTKRYRDRYLRYRTEVIARTESLRAVSAGQHLSILQASETGAIDAENLRRFWVFTRDGKTRNAHRTINDLNPEGVRIDQPFQTELGPLMFPRDPNGSAANTIQCRCAVRYELID